MDHYMDDLFGDGPQVQVPQLPIIKSLSSRLDELAGSNACKKIDWSKHGAIACVTPNGKCVQTHVLIRSQKSAKWKLSKAIPIPLDLEDSANNIVHVCWNYLGNELATIDSSGRIFIFNTSGVLGRLTPLRSGLSDPDTELNGIIAMYWLPIAQYANKVFMSATRTGSSWAYNREKLNHVMGPSNPIDRQGGLLALTRLGVLRLLYQGPNGQYMERTQELEVPGLNVDNGITHAAFAPHLEQNLLLTTYDNSCTLRLYQVGIKWNPEPTQDGQKPQALSPIMDIAPMIFEENAPPNPAGSNEQDGETSNGYIGPSLAISHLEIMPAVQTSAMKQPLPATIMAVFTPVSPSSAVVLDPTNQYHSTTSTICRWYIKQGNGPRLLPVFDELKSKGQRSAGSIEPKKDVWLERQPDHYMQALVLSVNVVRNETMFAFTLSDGSIEFRFRDSLELASADGNHEEVHFLSQSGFAFPAQDPVLQTALSPNLCCAATMQADGELKLKQMEYVVCNILELNDDEPQFGSLAALIAVTCLAGWAMQSGTDDLLAILPRQISNSLKNAIAENIWIAGHQAGANLTLFDPQSFSQVYGSGFTIKCMSCQYILGLGANGRMNSSSKVAWTSLNLRMVSWNLAQSINNPKHGDSLDIRTEVIGHIQFLAKWALDTLTYVIQELYEINTTLGNRINDITAVKEYIRQNSSPVIFLLICSMPRFFFRNLLGTIRKLFSLGRDVVRRLGSAPASEHPGKQAIWVRFQQNFMSSPIMGLLMQTQILDEYIKDIDGAIRAAYSESGTDPAQRMAIERGMFVGSDIPDVLNNAVMKSVLGNASKLFDLVQHGSIYKYELGWLGLTDEKIGIPGNSPSGAEPIFDVIRKFPIIGAASKKKMKRCPRCRSVAEEIDLGASGAHMGWLVQALRGCVCTNTWVLHDE